MLVKVSLLPQFFQVDRQRDRRQKILLLCWSRIAWKNPHTNLGNGSNVLERDLSNFITEFLKPLATSFIIFPGLTFRRINFLGLSFPGLSSPELLIIYTNYPALVHKHKTITFDMVGRGLENKPLKNISKSSEQTKKRRKTSSRQITAHIF